MDTVNYLNVGCGTKFHTAWTNVDMASTSPHVRVHNLLAGLPYPDDTFEAVYHSQVLEHFPKDRAPAFLAECFRVLAPGGVLRVVVPDLENIALEYLRLLKANLEGPTPTSVADYEWILLELLDQSVRDRSGGLMGAYLRQPALVNEAYLVQRVGYTARSAVAASGGRAVHAKSNVAPQRASLLERLRRVTPAKLFDRIRSRLFETFATETMRIGAFRTGGEVHLWMYDRFSLSTLLREVGFEDVRRVDPHTSAIPDWPRFELDVRDGLPFDPTSLFMEARKPVT